MRPGISMIIAIRTDKAEKGEIEASVAKEWQSQLWCLLPASLGSFGTKWGNVHTTRGTWNHGGQEFIIMDIYLPVVKPSGQGSKQWILPEEGNLGTEK